ncbi:MAG: LamG-like jellyroll fold domain-containing protein [Akkermansiaceae bacterium]
MKIPPRPLALLSGLFLTCSAHADLLVYYPFDIESGSVVANRGTQIDGTLSGGATYGPSQSPAYGSAFVGNRTGTNDGHVMTGLTGNDLGMGAGGVYTAMAWVSWAGASGAIDQMVFGQDDGNPTGNAAQLHHGIRTDSAANVHFGHWGNDLNDAGTVPGDGTWTHLAWQYDGTDAVVFVNGVESAREPVGALNSGGLAGHDRKHILGDFFGQLRIARSPESAGVNQTAQARHQIGEDPLVAARRHEFPEELGWFGVVDGLFH